MQTDARDRNREGMKQSVMGYEQIADSEQAGSEGGCQQQERRTDHTAARRASQCCRRKCQGQPGRKRILLECAQIPEVVPAQGLQNLLPAHGRVCDNGGIVHAVVAVTDVLGY